MLAALLALPGCGDLPRPFAGQPGGLAERLAQPPPARLAVVPPATALAAPLPDAGAADTLASALADALADREVPATASQPRPGDWTLTADATPRDGRVVPEYTIHNPDGAARGTVPGPPIDAAAWSRGAPDTLRQAAHDAAGPVADLLTAIEAARQQSDPNSLRNRPPRIVVTRVSGAPGDGNTALARQMRTALPKQGEVVQDTADGADFSVGAEVRTSPAGAGMTRVEIAWIVNDARGREAGRIVQLNDVPAGSLDAYWGDVAAVVADQAASGVRDVILNQTPGARPATSGAPSPAPGTPPSPAASAPPRPPVSP